MDIHSMANPDQYEDPEKFDMYRFIRISKQPDLASKALLVSATADHLAFGYGKHVCPGRFYAANAIKVLLCHLLLKYDWKVLPGSNPKPLVIGISTIVDPGTRLLFRRRKEELDFLSLETT